MSALGYALVCPLAYVVAGSLKFGINSLTRRRLAFAEMGLGGLPSTHTSIATAPAWMMLLKGGEGDAALALAIGLAMIVVIDALDTRRKMEKIIHVLKARFPQDETVRSLRDRTGHTPVEVLSGVIVGGAAALVVAAAIP